MSNARQQIRSASRALRDCAAASIAPVVAATQWRRERLLILGYHGISKEDEHLWDGSIYMAANVFRNRLEMLRKENCTVLPLAAALRHLRQGTLPPRSVSIVFDDGFHDFAVLAAPILQEYNILSTVFLSTYYAYFNRPVFDIMLHYLLWKAGSRTLSLPGLLESPIQLSCEVQVQVREELRQIAFRRRMSGKEKDELLSRVAKEFDIDYEALCRKRLLHMMNAGEVRAMKAAGHDIQLHTHRHRVSRRRDLFAREISDNREWIQKATGGRVPTYLSFPGGTWQPVALDWLSDLGIEVALTCHPALADKTSSLLHVPRVVDSSHLSARAFKGWLAGSMALFPRSKALAAGAQILEDTIHVPSDSGQDWEQISARAAS
jgi:peptidoglycan/xylan/chitin deacetylase (PgdA/CDA1 family)